MGTFYQSLRRWFGATGTTGQQAGIQYGEPFTRVSGSSGVTVPDYGIDGSLQVASVWSAMELLTDNIASLPIFVYKKNNNSPNGYKDLARDGSLYKLLHDSPNRRMTPMEFWQFMAMNFLLRGNAFARVVRNDNGEPIELWPMATDQVEIEVLKDRSIIYKYIYEGVVVVYGEDSVFHWKEKGNGTIGMSRLDFMRQTVGQAVAVQNSTTRTYHNGGKRPGVFMLDKTLTAKQRDQIRANFSDLVEGNNDRLMVLEAGAKFETLGMSPSDMQLDTTRRFTVEEVARWFGISGVLINDTQKATTWGTGVDSIIEAFYKFRLRTLLVGLEQAIELRILSPSQRARYEVEVSLDALLRGSLKERLETGAKAVQNGLLTRNEWRQMENLPPVTGADALTAQSNLLPVDKLGKMPTNGAQNADQTQPTAQ